MILFTRKPYILKHPALACASALVATALSELINSSTPVSDTTAGIFNEDFEFIKTVFNEMGVPLHRYDLQLSHITGHHAHAIATLDKNWLQKTLTLHLNLADITALEKNDSHFTHQDYIRAICAHEAVHARENHRFFIVFFTTLSNFLTLDLSIAYSVPLAFSFLFSLFNNGLMTALISRQLEYRADRIAATTEGPEITACLISMFETLEHQPHSQRPSRFWGTLFKTHPSLAERRKALLDLPHHTPVMPPRLT